MTHAVMAANIKGFNDLHLYIKEGAAELIHGVDDTRGGELRSYSKSTLIANLLCSDFCQAPIFTLPEGILKRP